MANVPLHQLTDVWNDSGIIWTGFSLNVTDTGSALGSKLFDFKIDGASKFSVAKDGTLIGVGLREKLAADRTYYVRTDGNNANNGLADTSGGAWATVQYALDYLADNIDLNGKMVTLQLNTGTHAGAGLGKVITGKGNIFIKGSTVNTTDIIISGASGAGLELSGSYLSVFYIGGVKLESSSYAPLVISNMRVYLGSPDGSTPAVRFGRTASAFFPLIYMDGANAYCTTWSAGTTIDVDTSLFPCGYFVQALNGAVASFGAVAFATTPTWSTAGLQATFGAIVSFNSADAIAGSAVGKRYEASAGGEIRRNTGTLGIDNLPGTVAGTWTSGIKTLTSTTVSFQNLAGTDYGSINAKNVWTSSIPPLTANLPAFESDHTWNNAAVNFRGVKINANITAAGADSRLLSLHTGGTAKWFVRPDGAMVWAPPASITPASNGEMTIEATSNTSVTIRLKGTDGTVRSAVLTLA